MKKRNIFENSASFLAHKSGQFINIGKLKLNLVNLENDIYNLKAKLGDAVYQSYKAGNDNSVYIEEMCNRLDQLYKQLQDMKNDMERLHGK